MEYKFNHNPTEKEIKEITKYHLSRYADYCRVWYENGSNEVFKNTIPICYYDGDNFFVTFRAREIMTEGSFGRKRIIRAKRYIRQISKNA